MESTTHFPQAVCPRGYEYTHILGAVSHHCSHSVDRAQRRLPLSCLTLPRADPDSTVERMPRPSLNYTTSAEIVGNLPHMHLPHCRGSQSPAVAAFQLAPCNPSEIPTSLQHAFSGILNHIHIMVASAYIAIFRGHQQLWASVDIAESLGL